MTPDMESLKWGSLCLLSSSPTWGNWTSPGASYPGGGSPGNLSEATSILRPHSFLQKTLGYGLTCHWQQGEQSRTWQGTGSIAPRSAV